MNNRAVSNAIFFILDFSGGLDFFEYGGGWGN